ncbi:DNA-directed RNA polymerase subunit beta [Jeotgalibacillus proteolyticus]|uniref:DNA-directed RNA polymerase subunit beta n=1 Tax=Jeotgalibacillus proteolyticus TaxID=2082395 RepID=A0A2S5G991_9BACL|nr:DNA-directed RNA polymerase subunit beta [Jeotgalibacillus proteolyticus]PPA69577.1 DNA-directed RNA polymerase subunit beta [Jeotgalibacillus proteolyticus]
MKKSLTKEEKVQSKQEKAAKKEQGESRLPRWVQVRRFPIIVRLLIVIILAAGCLILGLMVGYGVIGDGNPMDALKKETWTHILDIVRQGT